LYLSGYALAEDENPAEPPMGCSPPKKKSSVSIFHANLGPTLASHDSTCTIKFTSLLRSAKAGLTDVGTKFTTSLEWDVAVADADEKVRSEMPATSVEMRSYARPRGHVPGEGGVGGALATCFWPAGARNKNRKKICRTHAGSSPPR
jgi:hypothetical protein